MYTIENPDRNTVNATSSNIQYAWIDITPTLHYTHRPFDGRVKQAQGIFPHTNALH